MKQEMNNAIQNKVLGSKRKMTRMCFFLTAFILLFSACTRSVSSEETEVPKEPAGLLIDNGWGIKGILEFALRDNWSLYNQYLESMQHWRFYVSGNHIQIWNESGQKIIAEYDTSSADDFGCHMESFKLYSTIINGLQDEEPYLYASFKGHSFAADGPGEGLYEIEDGTLIHYGKTGGKLFISRIEEKIDAKEYTSIETREFNTGGGLSSHVLQKHKKTDGLGTMNNTTIYYDHNDEVSYYIVEESLKAVDLGGEIEETYRVTKYDKNDKVLSSGIETCQWGGD